MANSESENALRDAAGNAFESFRVALAKAPEPDRYRLLATFFEDLANHQQSQSGVSNAAEREHVELLGKKLQRINEERAQLADDLAASRADVEHRRKQLEAELERSSELERISNEQRERLKSTQQQFAELEEQVIAKNAALHEAENQVETLTLRLQRADLAAGDTSRVDAIEDDRRELRRQLEELSNAREQLRMDKDAEIERLKTELAEVRAAAARSGDETLAALWERLAHAKPHLAPGGVQPTPQAAERLFDAFIELALFTHDFDQSMRPFLGSLARYSGSLGRPWDAYAKSPGIDDLVRDIIDVQAGKPAAVLKARLVALKRWVIATIMGSDTAVESIAHELEEQLRGDVGMGNDPNRKVKDYVRDDGHQLFLEHIRELRSQKLADIYAHGV